MYSVGIYARLSVEDMDKQGNVDSRSIINQREMICDYCKEHGYEVTDIYVDDDITGMERNRPDFQRLLRDCESGRIDLVICKDQSRFARDDIVIKEYLQKWFLIWGVRFIGITDGVDSNSPDFMDNSSMRGFFNEYYVRDISKKVKSVFESKRRQGKFCHCAPYGYMKDPADNNHLIPDPAVRDNVVYVFEQYGNGVSLAKIAEELNAKGIPSPTAYKRNIYPKYNSRYTDNVWSSDGLRTMLKSEAYIGNTVQGKSVKPSYRSKKKNAEPKDKWVRVEGTHEPLISKELWELSKRRATGISRASRKTQTLQPLSGFVICGVCGKAMVRHVGGYDLVSGQKVDVSYYRCPDVTKGKGTCSNYHAINFKHLEPRVITEIQTAINTFCDKDGIQIAELQNETAARLEKQLKQLKDKAEKVQSRIDGLYTDKLDGVISTEEYMRYKDKFSGELTEIQKQIDDVSKKVTEYEERRKNSEYRDMLIQKYSSFDCLTREIAEAFIDNIIVGLNDENGKREVTVNLKV